MSGGPLIDHRYRFGGLIYGAAPPISTTSPPCVRGDRRLEASPRGRLATRGSRCPNRRCEAPSYFGGRGTTLDRRVQELAAANQALREQNDNVRMLGASRGLQGVAIRLNQSPKVRAAAEKVEKLRNDLTAGADPAMFDEDTRRVSELSALLLAWRPVGTRRSSRTPLDAARG